MFFISVDSRSFLIPDKLDTLIAYLEKARHECKNYVFKLLVLTFIAPLERGFSVNLKVFLAEVGEYGVILRIQVRHYCDLNLSHKCIGLLFIEVVEDAWEQFFDVRIKELRAISVLLALIPQLLQEAFRLVLEELALKPIDSPIVDMAKGILALLTLWFDHLESMDCTCIRRSSARFIVFHIQFDGPS